MGVVAGVGTDLLESEITFPSLNVLVMYFVFQGVLAVLWAVGTIIGSIGLSLLPDRGHGRNALAPSAQSSRALPTTRSPLPSLGEHSNFDCRVFAQNVGHFSWAVDNVRVGANRPDLQFTLDEQRYYIEYDTDASDRAVDHETGLNANDPDGIVVLLNEN
jgi:hypothetical protein